jgi:hypothetical protein
MRFCAWCREPIRGDSVPVDHLEFHPACAQSYRDWLRELKRISDEEIAKQRKSD